MGWSVLVGLGRARRHLAEPMVEGGEPSGQTGHDRHLIRGVSGHELRVLVIGRLAGELGDERADVVGKKPVHGGLLSWVLRRVEGVLRLKDPAVALIEDPEQPGVDVRELLTGIGPRGCSSWARCGRAQPDNASDASRTLSWHASANGGGCQSARETSEPTSAARQSEPAGSRIHVDATVRVPGGAVWCCKSVDFATFVLAGSAFVVARPRRERR
jgi:hypothetical protein